MLVRKQFVLITNYVNNSCGKQTGMLSQNLKNIIFFIEYSSLKRETCL